MIIIGGMLRQNTLAMVGPLAEHSLDVLRVDKAFMATNGLDFTCGLTTPNILEAATKAKMIAIAKQVILLADHTKFGKVSFAKFADVTSVDICVMDDKASEDMLEKMAELEISVCVVNP